MFRYVYGSLKRVALDKRSKNSLTFGAYIIEKLCHYVKHFSHKYYDFDFNIMKNEHFKIFPL